MQLAKRTLNITLRDLNTAKRLLTHKDHDWTLSIAYNSMLQAGHAPMFLKSYSPSTHYGHVAVVKFVRITLEKQVISRMTDILTESTRGDTKQYTKQ